eukprot:5124509-Pleurochrysis_carterae.AAC.2
MHCPNLLVADKLTNQEGANAYYNNGKAHSHGHAGGTQYTSDAVEPSFEVRSCPSPIQTKLSSAVKLHSFLREHQIKMRVLGLSPAEHAILWSTGGRQRSKDELLNTLAKVPKAEP